jgi:uncharacterized membrane protein YfcA
MDVSLIITFGIGLIIGVCLGLLGGGGAILAVPTLTYITGLDPVQAIPSSLLIVGVTSAASLIMHALKGRVQWRTGITFGLASMAGAFVGGRLGSSVPAPILMFSFAAVMIAAGTAMVRGRKETVDDEAAKLPVNKIVITGAAVGLVSGFVGAGGGFLIVPALALLARLPMKWAVATSLLVTTMQSASGLAGYAVSTPLDWGLALSIAGIAVVGSLLGFWLSSRVPERGLRKGFGIFVLVMAALVVIQETLKTLG